MDRKMEKAGATKNQGFSAKERAAMKEHGRLRRLHRQRMNTAVGPLTPSPSATIGRVPCHEPPIEFDLLEQRSFEQGVTMHRYAIRNEGEATPC